LTKADHNSLSLLELNRLVKDTLEKALPDTYWVVAEIASMSDRTYYCFLDLVQKDEQGNTPVAQARASIWRPFWPMLRKKFELETGQSLRAGIKVMLGVTVDFSERYGFQYNVKDLDGAYTLGDMERRRQQILQKLTEEGIIDDNKNLQLPTLLQRIAVISSPTAAGYQDFERQLHDNAYGLAFRTELFAATMQGETVESTVIAALNAVAQRADDFDAVVIIRGGGAVADLSGFDTLPLAENVAQFPLPIITGLGHERDNTVLDRVAHTRVKTPTAAAEFLVQHQLRHLQWLSDCADILATTARDFLAAARIPLENAARLLPLLAERTVSNRKSALMQTFSRVERNVTQQISRQQTTLQALWLHAEMQAKMLLQQQTHTLQMAENELKIADPQHILRLGYSITRINGRAITDAAQAQAGDTINTTLSNGTITSKIL